MNRKYWIAVVFMALSAWANQAGAATLVVDSLNDGPPANDGNCTLREAVLATNYDVNGNDCIAMGTYGIDQIEVPLTGSIVLTGPPGDDVNASGDLDVLDDLVISNTGGGTLAIDGNGNDRVFDVRQIDTDLVLNSLVIENGSTSIGEVGGGIQTLLGGTLTLNDCVVQNNLANGGGSNSVRGGGIDSGSDVFLNRTEVIGNSLINSGTQTAFGGGVFVIGANLTVVESRISGNAIQADGFTRGGGVYAGNGGTVLLYRSEVALNSLDSSGSSAQGGGLYIFDSDVEVVNSTISGNSATTDSASDGDQGQGGGLLVDLEGNRNLLINNATISANAVSAKPGASAFAGGVNATDLGSGSIQVANTILANNTANGSASDCINGGLWTSGGYNLMETNCGLPPTTGDQFGVDPMLEPLADNGGSSTVTNNPRTHALPPGSPAVDLANPVVGGTYPECRAADQRGFSRPADGGLANVCDIGAFELSGDGSGQLAFEEPSYAIAEDGGTLAVTVIRTGGTNGQVSVDFSTLDAPSASYDDFVNFSGTLNFSDGITTSLILISITDDTLFEGTEQFTVTLSNPTGGAVIVSPEFTLVDILDDEQTRTVPALGSLGVMLLILGMAVVVGRRFRAGA